MFKKKSGITIFSFIPTDSKKPYGQQLLELIGSKSEKLNIYDSLNYDILEIGDDIFIRIKDKNPNDYAIRMAEYFMFNGEKCLRTIGYSLDK